MAIVRWDGGEEERSVGDRVAPGGGDGIGLGEEGAAVVRNRNEVGTDCSDLVNLLES